MQDLKECLVQIKPKDSPELEWMFWNCNVKFDDSIFLEHIDRGDRPPVRLTIELEIWPDLSRELSMNIGRFGQDVES